MYFRNMIWMVFVILFHFFSWYMIMCFCAIYVNSSLGWIYGTALSILLDAIVLQVSFSLLKSLFREIARIYEGS
jgi:hypothetical protein